MKKLLNKSVGLVLAVFLFVSLIVAGAATIDISLLRTKAEYSRDYSELTDEELDTLSFRTSVSDDSPQITVFTHGYGSSPSHWTSDDNYNFAYEEASMVGQLCRKLDGEDGEEAHTVVFQAAVQYSGQPWNGKEYTLEEATSELVSDINSMYPEVENSAGAASLRNNYNKVAKEEDYDTPEERENLTNRRSLQLGYCNPKNGYNIGAEDLRDKLTSTDVSKHIIVIFDATDSRRSNDFVYGELEYILDVVSYQYCQLTGNLPTYNLIGHSRGGMTNLQYALGHPYNVASLYSMGTPYSGSALGEAARAVSWLSLVMKKNFTYTDKAEDDYWPGVQDILNSELNESYKNYWNDHYSEYSHIKFKPIGSYVTFGFILQFLAEFMPDGVLEGIVRGLALVVEMRSAIRRFSISKLAFRRLVVSAIDIVKDLLKKAVGTPDNSLIQILDNIRTMPVAYPHLGLSFNVTFSYADDLFIDLNSQVAEGYTGRDVKVRLMDTIDQMLGKKNVDQPGVAHNLETHDPYIVDYVINDLSAGQGEAAPYDVRYVQEGCVITNLRFNENEDKSILIIPEEYKGKTVVGIDRLTRDIEVGGDKTYRNEISKIIIPKTVKEISDYAFYGMSNLKTVEFANGSVLEGVGVGSFMNCKTLTGIVLPDTVKEIEMGAFSGCSAITSFVVGKEVTSLGAGSFIGCDKLTEISVEAGNTVYSSQDGILFSEQGTMLVVYPQGRAGVSYTVPSQVIEIGAYAFVGNSKLQSINLNQAVMIREGGLANCSALTTITANSLKYVEVGALDGTAWFKNQTDDQVILGEVLLSYQGEATTVSLQNVSSIAPYAFAENTNLQTLTIDDPLHNIGDGAFYQCENLQNLYIKNINEMVYIGLGILGGTSAKIHIPKIRQGEYTENELWEQYEGSLELISTTVHFNSNGGSAVSDGTLWYGSEVGELPVPTKPENRFIGWKYNDGTGMKLIDSAYRWMYISDEVEFVAEWEPIEYTIELNPNGGTVENFEGLYTSEEGKTLPVPTREGYVFKGWYDNAAFSGNSITEIEPGSTGNKTYYAKWQEAEYTVTLDYGYEGCPASLEVKVTYNKTFTLPVPEKREGFMFNGWKTTSGMFYADENGESIKVWDKTGNETLIADWTREEYAITVNPENGHIIWMTPDGFSDVEVFIPYGTEFKDVDELEAAFNPDKLSLKEGYKFDYFQLENGTRFEAWEELPDLGENRCTYKIYTHFTKEVGFTIDYLGVVVDGETNPLVKDYNEPITLLRPEEKPGYIFEGWYVADVELNRKYYISGSPYEIGTKFDYVKMPDLSYGIEANAYHIALEAKYTPKKIKISYVPYYGSSIASTVINYGSKVVLPIPDERNGYKFVGWYIGSNGTGEQYTDGEGQLLKEWDKETNTTLYAKWEMETYTITYMSNGVPLTGMVFNTYTVTSTTITLETPSKTGYRFMGWYTNSNFTGTRVYNIPKGSTGNKTFYAKWSYLYTITFNSNGGSTCGSIKGISGEVITLPTSSRSYYTGQWERSGKVYNFGDSYTIVNSTTFTAKWTPIEYKIHYMIFGKEFTPPLSEKDKRTFTVERDTEFWNPTPTDPNWYVFDGWYASSNFTGQVKNTNSFSVKEITVYGRWKYVRPGQFTVTDDGVFNQPSDWIDLKKMTGYSLAQLKSKGYKSITFTGSITAWQENDGYKYVQVYDGTSSSAKMLSEWWVDHRDGKTKRVYQLNNDGSWTFNLDALTNDILCFRYTASGAFSDTWYNNDCWITVKSLSK